MQNHVESAEKSEVGLFHYFSCVRALTVCGEDHTLFIILGKGQVLLICHDFLIETHRKACRNSWISSFL